MCKKGKYINDDMIFYNNFGIELEIFSKYLCRTAMVVIPEEDTLLCEILEGLATMSYVIVNGCVSRHCFVLSGHGSFVRLTSCLLLQGH